MQWQVEKDTLENFASVFWQEVKNKKVFAFHGEMGAGKTTIISALCKYKGVDEAVGSPTFSIINEYVFYDSGAERKIFHIDLYRLNDIEEIVKSGVEDCVYSGEICFVEWPNKAQELFDEDAVHVFIEPLSPTTRIVKI